MISCPNKRLLAWKKLVEIHSEPKAYLLWAEYDGNVPENYYENLNTPDNLVKTGLKATDILMSEKAIQMFNKGQKANWDLNKILTELQIPKEQKQLILDLNIDDREQIALELANNYSYTVEINQGEVNIEKMKEVNTSVSKYYSPSEDRYYRYTEELGWISSDKDNKNQEHDVKTPEDLEPFEYNSEYLPVTEKIKSDFYSNLTVPGGTNYTENAHIIPELKGKVLPDIYAHHDQEFAQGNLDMYGWDRSDDKSNIAKTNEDLKNAQYQEGQGYVVPTKIRRILEIQSKFQKWRLNFEHKNNKYQILENQPTDKPNVFEDHYLENGKRITSKEYNKIFEEFLDTPTSKEDAFIKLIAKQWETMMIKSIIQNSAKKGYEKVLFPTGNTASKVEGHTTLEEFKKQKEDRIKYLEDINTSSEYNRLKQNGEYKNADFESIEAVEKQIMDERKIEIHQLKQELERIETEGFGALKPIYNFYENTVTNILNKTYGKDNIKQITDEYGNTWNEIELNNEASIILLNKKDLSEFIGSEKSFFDNTNESKKTDIKSGFLKTNKQLLFKNGELTTSYTAKNVLQNIIDSDLDLTDNTTTLIFKAMNILNIATARVKVCGEDYFDRLVKDSPGEGTPVMVYNSDSNAIYVTEKSLNIFKPSNILEAFLHELAHNLSIKALVKPETFEEKEFRDLIFKAYDQYKYLGRIKDQSKSYGFTNEKEFVAELYSNEAFRNEIKELDKGFWRKFKDAIRRLFGLPKSLQNDDLIDSILLIESVEKFIENNNSNFQGFSRNDYSNAFDSILFKKVEPKDIELDTLDKQLQHTINLSKDKIDQLLKRTKSYKKVKNKEDHDKFIKSFELLLEEIKKFEEDNKWKSIVSYVKSFSSAISSLNINLDNLLYDKDTDTFTKNIDSDTMLETINRYDEYLAAYDLLNEINSLIGRSENDISIKSVEKSDINEIKSILSNLKQGHDKIVNNFLNVRRAYAVKEFSKPENNTRVVTEWRNKLNAEHSKLGITDETKEAYFGRMINSKYKSEYQQSLLDSARKIVYDPSFDITSATRNTTDILNTDSSLINIMSNIIGKMRDKIISLYHDKNFEIDKLYKKYSKEKGQNSQSKMYGNLIELSKNGQYYLKGKYSIDFLNTVENDLYPLLNTRRELIQKLTDEGLNKYKIKKHPEYKALGRNIASWFKEHTVKIDNKTQPKAKYKNKNLTGIEKETLDYFISETEKNDEIYNGLSSLIKNLYGSTFYKIPSVTKTDLERTLEGDIKGQLKDKWTDLTQIKTDDVNFGEAINSKNKEYRTVRIHYRGKIDSKDQSLDLFSVYRKEALNAINYGEKKNNELKLKLFLDIAGNKQYKKRSKITDKWAQNKYATNSPGVIFNGEFSEELKRIEGLLESNLYDILSYNGQKVLGTNIEAQKLAGIFNGAAASIAMTANLGAGTANVLNGVTQLFIDSVGGHLFNKTDLIKAEANYSKNLMNILADLNQPVKKSFHNQMLDMFDIMGGFDNATQEFIRNSYAKKLISKKSMNGLNEMGEHMMNSVLTEVILRGTKVMNEQRQFIDKEGNIVEESKAASLFDMLFLNEDGKLVMSDKVVYTKKNLDTKYHEGGKQHINYVIKKKGHDIFGVYDPLMKAEIAKTWWGKTLLMFKNFFLSAFRYRYKGLQSSLKAKEDLTDDELTFNNAEQEFTEGIYTTFVRFIKYGVIPALKGLQLAHIRNNYNSLSDYEKANLKKTTLEIGLTMVILPMLGMLLGAAAGGDDDTIYFSLYVFRRLESELSQFRDPRELNRMIQNPVAANRFIQNSLTAMSDIITPFNFGPKNNEEFLDYFSKDSEKNNILLKHVKKVTPFYAQMQKDYKQLYTIFDK